MPRSRARARPSSGSRSAALASLRPARVAVVAAHPDDEVLGLGGRLGELAGLTLVHLTAGSPRDLADARRAGFASCAAYARARELELARALAAAGAAGAQRFTLDAVDQGAVFQLTTLVRQLVPILAQAQEVITHPYEGGHPDHDAAAFAVQAACAELQRVGAAAFATQRAVLAEFPVETERTRPAPRYDFLAPPPPGVALYDRFGWSIESGRWRSEAARALDALGHDAARAAVPCR